MTVRREDPKIPIDKDGVKFVNEDICFVYSGSGFAVTTDAGKSWTLWNAEKHNYLDERINAVVIRSIQIGVDGKGEMTVQTFPATSGACQTLSTLDYGRSWVNGRFVGDEFGC